MIRNSRVMSRWARAAAVGGLLWLGSSVCAAVPTPASKNEALDAIRLSMSGCQVSLVANGVPVDVWDATAAKSNLSSFCSLAGFERHGTNRLKFIVKTKADTPAVFEAEVLRGRFPTLHRTGIKLSVKRPAAAAPISLVKVLAITRTNPTPWAFAEAQRVGKLTSADRKAIFNAIDRICTAMRQRDGKKCAAAYGMDFAKAAGYSRTMMQSHFAAMFKAMARIHARLVVSKHATWSIEAFGRGVLVRALPKAFLFGFVAQGHHYLPVYNNLLLCKTPAGWVVEK